MSLSSDLRIESGRKTVTAAGTREPLMTGKPDEVRVRSVTIRGLTGNSGNIYVGDERVTSTTYSYVLTPGEPVDYSVDPEEWVEGHAINLSKIFIDADTNGEGVCFTYVRD